MKRLILNLALICFLIETLSAKLVGEKLYKTENNKLYYIDENYKYSWYEAFLQCSLKKMSLATLETLEEHDAISKILKDDNFSHHGPHLWIGAVGGNRLFSWVSNSQPVFTTKWIPGNPDNYLQEENCLHFWENTTELNDRKCDYKYGFICEETVSREEVAINHEKYKSVALSIVINNEK
ncbi:lectin subunit alpha-like [Lucilia cuprina]|uniref:lectin subunit alpha-like n=1 Tax=Lucilia cuprina TaxID=7375 RepID=UPI001F070A3A|nr:lectin subunit alpha-like [Lucilia cuprina]